MKIKIYNQNQLGFFSVYPSNVNIDTPQENVLRQNGYEMHQLFLISEGSGILEIEGKTYSLDKNDFLYLASGIPHSYYGITDDFCTSYLGFFGDGFDGIKKYYNLKNYGVYKNKNRGSFETSLKNLFETFDTADEVSSLCAQTLSCIVAFFDEACRVESEPIETVYKYLEENYSKPLTLDDILSVYPYSKAKLCRDFKDRYKQTIFQAVTDIRLRHAHRLIRSFPHLRLTKIASSCGFSDISYFCKMYRRKYGHSPKGR